MAFIKVAKVSQLKEGKLMYVDADGEDVCLINSGGNFYAVQEYCTHEDGPLHEGHIENGQVVCPLHQAKFDIKTGKVDPETDWAPHDIKTFGVKVDGDDIFVDV